MGFIVKEGDEDYYCIICGCRHLAEIFVRLHVKKNRHAESLTKYGSDIIPRKDKRYYCKLCDCQISGYQCVHQHLMGKMHQEILNESDLENSDESPDDDEIELGDYIIQVNDTHYDCFICDYDMYSQESADAHANGSRHAYALDTYGCDISFNGNQYYCKLCECLISGYKCVYQHLIGKRHQDFLDEYDAESNKY